MKFYDIIMCCVSANVTTLGSEAIKIVLSLSYIFAHNNYTCTGTWYWQINCCGWNCRDGVISFFSQE